MLVSNTNNEYKKSLSSETDMKALVSALKGSTASKRPIFEDY